MRGRKLELTGKRFGKLQVTRDLGMRSGKSLWACQCDCGAEIEALSTNLTQGTTTSCGCIRRDLERPASEAATRSSWKNMMSRCHNEKDPSYPRYGGRGIRVCTRWQDYRAFLTDMGLRPGLKSIERKDGSGHYEPGNCYWATAREQGANRCTTHKVELDGVVIPLAALAREFGLPTYVLVYRVIRRGWPLERALQTPIRRSSRKA